MTTFTDEFWLAQAQHYATASKDPTTRVGCVIVRDDNSFCSAGVNGFPHGIADTEDRLHDRDVKNDLTVHAEQTALNFATESVKGYTAYCTFSPCVRCAVSLIQSRIARVVFLEAENTRWAESQKRAIDLFLEAGISVSEVHADGSKTIYGTTEVTTVA